MKNIVLLYDFLSEDGGIERVLEFQAKTLRSAGFNVKIAFAFVNEESKSRFKDFEVIEYSKLPFGLKNETFQILLSFFSNRSLKYFSDSELIITHSFPSSYIAYRLKKKNCTPYIQFLHHHPQFLYFRKVEWAVNTLKRKIAFFAGFVGGYFLKKVDKKCVNSADGIMVNSNMVSKIAANLYNVKSEVIYPPVDDTFLRTNYDKNTLRKYKIEGNYILASGRIVKLKRFDYLLEAFSKLPENLKKNNQIIFAGKENEKERENLDILAKNLNISDKVRFLGPINKKDLASLYSFAKLTVLTCPGEYFGLVPVEAMACGCPVVAWKDNSGPEETVKNQISGFLTKPYDTSELSKNIQKTLEKKWDKKKIIRSIDKFCGKQIKNYFLRSLSKVKF